MTNIVQVHNLRKQYNPPDGVVAVKGISFDIRQGEIFSLLGPNGAGKTTTISMLSCLLAPTAGDAIVAGHSVTSATRGRQTGHRRRAPGDRPVPDHQRPREPAPSGGGCTGWAAQRLQARIETALTIAGLADRADDKVETYSGGMKRRLNIAVGLLHEPQVLYLDEPTVGIDPQSRRRILDTIKTLNEQGMTVLYTTHYMEEAEELSDRIGIIDHGELIAIGTLEELTQMVGECDIIRLGVEFNGADHERLLADLRAQAGVQQVVAEDGNLLLSVTDADTALADVVVAVARAGAHVRQLEIREPNLEAVFLHLTGRALRD